MGPPTKTLRAIWQDAFDELVKETMEDLGMDPTEALQDAIETLTLQGVDLSGIVSCVPGEGNAKGNPVMQCLDRLKQLESVSKGLINSDDMNEILSLFDKLIGECNIEGSGNSAIAVKNGGLQLVCSICSKIPIESVQVLVLALKTLALLIYDAPSTEIFRSSGGPTILADILKDGSDSLDILDSGFSVLAAAATGNEILKDSFMELKIDELILQVLNRPSKGSIQSVCDAIRVLVTPDDSRVVASQVYSYARRFAKIGIAGALVESLHGGLASPSLVSASIALKAVAVNDEICKSIAERGGIDAILQCIDDSGEQGNKTVGRNCCSLLSKVCIKRKPPINKNSVPISEQEAEACKRKQLAGSDSNTSDIIEKGGLIQLSTRFSDDPSVLQEVKVRGLLCAIRQNAQMLHLVHLPSPDNAARAIEAGAGDLAIQAMEKFPSAQQLQKNSCFMIRNLVVRNPENRTILLSHGIEKIVRRARENHPTCKDAATDALRDLGVDNYNS